MEPTKWLYAETIVENIYSLLIWKHPEETNKKGEEGGGGAHH